MKTRALLITLAASLMLVGAGCDGTDSTNASVNAPKVNLEIPEGGMPKGETKAAEPTAMDEGWKTYENADMGITFQWPSKGVNAPQWAVLFPKASDAKLKDGCYGEAGGTKSALKSGDVEFCHIASEAKDGAAADYYATKIHDQAVVLSFSKKSPAGVKDFSWEDYRKSLDHIATTFKSTK